MNKNDVEYLNKVRDKVARGEGLTFEENASFVSDPEWQDAMWAKVSQEPDWYSTSPEEIQQWEQSIYAFLTRTWPKDYDVQSIKTYAERVNFTIARTDPGNTFMRRFGQYVPQLIELLEKGQA